jgi:hypothetical protein
MEAEVLKLTQQLGIGAQFGGKYFCHDVRVIRLPRHGASLPIAIAVSCSADRQAKAKITKDGIFLENLERDPAQFLPDIAQEHLIDSDEGVVKIDLNAGMDQSARRARQTSSKDSSRVSPERLLLHEISLMPRSKRRWMQVHRCPITYGISQCITQDRPKRQLVMHLVHLDQRPPVAWILMWSISNPVAALMSCWQKVIAPLQ